MGKKPVIIILILILASVCQAATFYVSTDGTNGNDCNNIATPCRDVKYAYALVGTSGTYIIDINVGTYSEPNIVIGSAKNAVTLTLQGRSTDSNENVFSSTTNIAVDLSNYSAAGGGSLTIKNMTLTSEFSTNARWGIRQSSATGGAQVYLDNATIGTANDAIAQTFSPIKHWGLTYASQHTRNLTAYNSRLYSKNSYVLDVNDYNNITFTDCLLDSTNDTTSKNTIYLLGTIGDVNITGTTIKSKGRGLYHADTSGGWYLTEPPRIRSLYLNNNVWECGDHAVLVKDFLESAIITHQDSNMGFCFGHVYEANLSSLGDIYMQYVDVNRVITDANYGTFGLVLGLGVKKAKIYDCNFIGNPIISIKAQADVFGDVDIQRCLFDGGYTASEDQNPIYIRSAKRFNMQWCTIRGRANTAIKIFDQTGIEIPEGTDTDYWNISNCIIDGSLGSDYTIELAANCYNSTMDWNCYVAPSVGSFAYISGVGALTFEQWKAWWTAQGTSNDAHSIVVPSSSDVRFIRKVFDRRSSNRTQMGDFQKLRNPNQSWFLPKQ